LLATNPASKRSQEKLKLDALNHAASISRVQQVVAFQRIRVFGYYAIPPFERLLGHTGDAAAVHQALLPTPEDFDLVT
jgi:hypothetical protein